MRARCFVCEWEGEVPDAGPQARCPGRCRAKGSLRRQDEPRQLGKPSREDIARDMRTPKEWWRLPSVPRMLRDGAIRRGEIEE